VGTPIDRLMMELPDRLSGIMRLDPDAAAIHTPTASHPWSSVLSLFEDLNRNLELAEEPPGARGRALGRCVRPPVRCQLQSPLG
jgi:hypothetical protein